MLGYDEGTKLGSTDSKVLGTILGNEDRITLGLDVGTYLVSLYGSFDGFNNVNIEGLLLGGSLQYNHGKVLGSDEYNKLGISDGKVTVTILVNVYEITLH